MGFACHSIGKRNPKPIGTKQCTNPTSEYSPCVFKPLKNNGVLNNARIRHSDLGTKFGIQMCRCRTYRLSYIQTTFTMWQPWSTFIASNPASHQTFLVTLIHIVTLNLCLSFTKHLKVSSLSIKCSQVFIGIVAPLTIGHKRTRCVRYSNPKSKVGSFTGI